MMLSLASIELSTIDLSFGVGADNAIQLNDVRFHPLCPLLQGSLRLTLIAIPHAQTHPTLAIVELMRILIDEEDLHWDQAWTIVTNTFFFTNHTVLPVRPSPSSARSSRSSSHALFGRRKRSR